MVECRPFLKNAVYTRVKRGKTRPCAAFSGERSREVVVAGARIRARWEGAETGAARIR